MRAGKPGSILALALAVGSPAALAQHVVFKCIDETGRPQYTNVKSDMDGRRCEVVQGEVSIVPANAPVPAPRAKPPAQPPTQTAANRTDSNAGREASRRRILEDELAQEEQLLQRARSDLAAQEGTRGGDERNYQRVLDRLKPYQDTVERHARNIEALRKELATNR